MFGGFGTTELIIILVLAFMIFGVGKLPQVAKMLGSGVNSFRKGLNGEDDDESEEPKKKEPELLEEDQSAKPAATEQQRQAERSESW
jgi:TatA/E family protein of Tat protein translocase